MVGRANVETGAISNCTTEHTTLTHPLREQLLHVWGSQSGLNCALSLKMSSNRSHGLASPQATRSSTKGLDQQCVFSGAAG